ncbi:MAG: hypothetical protein NT178_16985, partial [Proteobacteria bacterium]|nr:hypothetical protein [Pseudomonadota bacterium]
MDAPRGAIYSATLDNSDVMWMNKMVKAICNDYNVEYIDLTSFMKEDFKRNGMKFNSEFDYHWNKYGHDFVSNVLTHYLA